MMSPHEDAALVALLRRGQRTPQAYSDQVEAAGSALAVLEQELGGRDQTSLLTPAIEDLLNPAQREITRWAAQDIRPLTLLDPDYPKNLRAVHDRPPLLFLVGKLRSGDCRSIAVIGSRRASPTGIDTARQIAEQLVAAGYVVVSGLAAGIDTAAHTGALRAGGRTLAVIGTGLEHAYPAQNSELQNRVASECAVISQFWPEQSPSRQGFRLRNALMSGMALGTVIVEASVTSGARIHARRALAHGRPVFLMSPLVSQAWARELAARPGVYVVPSAAQIISTMARLHDSDALVG